MARVSETYFPAEVWEMVTSYLLHDKLRAKKVVQQHTALPYVLSLHQYKGLSNTLEYLQLREAWVFQVLPRQQITNTIRATQRDCRD